MALRIATYRIGSSRKKGEGLRIGVVRFLPRGVPKREYGKRDLFDVWLPVLAPSKKLVTSFFAEKKSSAQFFRAYRAEMKQPAARHTIQLLAALAKRTPLAIGCYCEDESRCHRSALISLIRRAAK